MKRVSRVTLGVLFLSVILGISGCEQVSGIVDYFKGKSKKDVSTPTQEAKVPVQKPMEANVLAKIGKWKITIEEFNERLSALKEVVPDYDITDPEAKKLVLEELIRQQLLVENAEQIGLENKKDIAAAVEEFRRTLIVREVARKLTEHISVSEEEAAAFYKEKREQLVEPARYRVREIVLDSQLKANEILVQLLKGDDFGLIAEQNSISESASNGGDLGFIDSVPSPQFGNALLSLEEGDVSSVFQGPEGYCIIKLEEKQGGTPLAYEEIKDQIIQSELIRKQQEVLLKYLAELEGKIKVEKNEGLLR